MTTMISIQQASRPVNQEDIDFMIAHHDETIGDAAEVPQVLVNPNDPTQIAIVGKVFDLEAMRERSRGETAKAFEKQRNVSLTQLFYFMEA